VWDLISRVFPTKVVYTARSPTETRTFWPRLAIYVYWYIYYYARTRFGYRFNFLVCRLFYQPRRTKSNESHASRPKFETSPLSVPVIFIPPRSYRGHERVIKNKNRKKPPRRISQHNTTFGTDGSGSPPRQVTHFRRPSSSGDRRKRRREILRQTRVCGTVSRVRLLLPTLSFASRTRRPLFWYFF